jgi:hypothetical protein
MNLVKTALIILKLKGINGIIKVLRSKMDRAYRTDEAMIAYELLSKGSSQGLMIDVGDATWMEVSKDERKILSNIDHVMQVLNLLEPPPPAEKCAFCKYRADSMTHGW